MSENNNSDYRSEQWLYTRFSILNSLRDFFDDDTYINHYGQLYFRPGLDRIDLKTSKGSYCLHIKDNKKYSFFFKNASKGDILDSVVLDDDSLLLSQRALNNAKMSFVYVYDVRRSITNADLPILKFDSNEDSEERSLLTVIQIMCALFGDLDKDIVEFFIEMSNYYFTGNYTKPGVDRSLITAKNSYQTITEYLKRLYSMQAVPHS